MRTHRQILEIDAKRENKQKTKENVFLYIASCMRPNAEPSAQFQILPLGSELDIVCNMGEYVLLQSIWSLVLPYQQASVADLISSSVA